MRSTVLLLENEENDVFFFRRALSRCGCDVDVRVVGSVGEARDYIEGRGQFCDRVYYPRPDLIISDFKMYGHTGVDFIRWMKANPDYKQIPIVMYSGTALASDRAAARESGALAIFQKSGDFSVVCERIAEIMKFLPPKK